MYAKVLSFTFKVNSFLHDILKFLVLVYIRTVTYEKGEDNILMCILDKIYIVYNND